MRWLSKKLRKERQRAHDYALALLLDERVAKQKSILESAHAHELHKQRSRWVRDIAVARGEKDAANEKLEMARKMNRELQDKLMEAERKANQLRVTPRLRRAVTELENALFEPGIMVEPLDPIQRARALARDMSWRMDNVNE